MNRLRDETEGSLNLFMLGRTDPSLDFPKSDVSTFEENDRKPTPREENSYNNFSFQEIPFLLKLTCCHQVLMIYRFNQI